MKKTATIKQNGQYQRLVEPKFNLSNRTIELIDDLLKDEEQALRVRKYIIDIMLLARQGETSMNNDYDVLFYWLNEFIDQVMEDRGLKSIDHVVPF